VAIFWAAWFCCIAISRGIACCLASGWSRALLCGMTIAVGLLADTRVFSDSTGGSIPARSCGTASTRRCTARGHDWCKYAIVSNIV